MFRNDFPFQTPNGSNSHLVNINEFEGLQFCVLYKFESIFEKTDYGVDSCKVRDIYYGYQFTMKIGEKRRQLEEGFTLLIINTRLHGL